MMIGLRGELQQAMESPAETAADVAGIAAAMPAQRNTNMGLPSAWSRSMASPTKT